MIRSVALISNSAFSIVNFRGTLIRALNSAGVKVFALAPDFEAEIEDEVRQLGAIPIPIAMDRTGIGVFRNAADLFRLWRVLRNLRPDASFAYFLKPVIYGSLAAAAARIPKRFAMIEGLGYVFADAHGGATVRRKVLRWLTERLCLAALSTVSRVFFLNEDDRSLFLERHLVTPGKACNIGGIGVDLEAFSFARHTPGALMFLLAARLLREKGICEFVDAARRIKRRHPDARFVLLGQIDTNPGGLALSEVERWVMDDIVEWPGHVANVAEWIAESSVFVLPSYYREGVPRSTQEALAIGRPIITTDNVGCRETVVDGVNGYLIPVRDVDALEAAMLRFINDPSIVSAMGLESRKLAEERFDSRRVNETLLTWMGIDPSPNTNRG